MNTILNCGVLHLYILALEKKRQYETYRRRRMYRVKIVSLHSIVVSLSEDGTDILLFIFRKFLKIMFQTSGITLIITYQKGVAIA